MRTLGYNKLKNAHRHIFPRKDRALSRKPILVNPHEAMSGYIIRWPVFFLYHTRAISGNLISLSCSVTFFVKRNVLYKPPPHFHVPWFSVTYIGTCRVTSEWNQKVPIPALLANVPIMRDQPVKLVFMFPYDYVLFGKRVIRNCGKFGDLENEFR